MTTRVPAALTVSIAMLMFVGCAPQGAEVPGAPTPSAVRTAAADPAPEPDPHPSLAGVAGVPWPAPPNGPVVATGLVMQRGDRTELCLGAIGMSDPPSCGGPQVLGWHWPESGNDIERGDTRWGSYGMSGTYDGITFTPESVPIDLALFDSVVGWQDPTGGAPGTTDPGTLATIQSETKGWFGETLLMSGVEDGRLWIDVVWDDGTWQAHADSIFGPGVVIIRPALLTLPAAD